MLELFVAFCRGPLSGESWRLFSHVILSRLLRLETWFTLAGSCSGSGSGSRIGSAGLGSANSASAGQVGSDAFRIMVR
jgi:hypothetical protein